MGEIEGENVYSKVLESRGRFERILGVISGFF